MNHLKGLVSCSVAFVALAFTGVAYATDTITIDPLGSNAVQGTTVTFTGSLVNGDGIDEPLKALTVNFLTEPSGADPSTAAVFDTYFGPDPLLTTGYIGQIFSLDIDPAAPDGTYTGNFDVVYDDGSIDGSDANTNFSFTIGSATTATPEPSATVVLALGLAGLGLLAYKSRRKSSNAA